MFAMPVLAQCPGQIVLPWEGVDRLIPATRFWTKSRGSCRHAQMNAEARLTRPSKDPEQNVPSGAVPPSEMTQEKLAEIKTQYLKRQEEDRLKQEEDRLKHDRERREDRLRHEEAMRQFWEQMQKEWEQMQLELQEHRQELKQGKVVLSPLEC